MSASLLSLLKPSVTGAPLLMTEEKMRSVEGLAHHYPVSATNIYLLWLISLNATVCSLDIMPVVKERNGGMMVIQGHSRAPQMYSLPFTERKTPALSFVEI